jgi:dTMP kinase
VEPRFITLEGGEGAGKSTQVRLLVEALRRSGIDTIQTREPGGAAGAEEIRTLLVTGAPGRWDGTTELLLHAAARRDHLVKTVWPALAAGQWVVSDRFADSTAAYQGAGHDLPGEAVSAVYRVAVGDFAPDLTIILDLPVAEGLARAKGRGGAEDRYERMGVAFHEKLRQAFLRIAAAEPQRCVVLSAAPDPAEVHRAICASVEERLGVVLSPQ